MRCICGFEGVELWFLKPGGGFSALCRCCQFGERTKKRATEALRFSQSYKRRVLKQGTAPKGECPRCIEIERFYQGY